MKPQDVDMTWITLLGIGELIIVGIISLGGIALWKFLPGYVQKKAEVSLAQISAEKEALIEKTNEIVKSYGDALQRIEGVMVKNEAAVQHLQITTDAQTDVIKAMSRQTLENTVYNENMPVLKRLRAFREYLGLGGNGNCKEFAIKTMILINMDSVKLWQSVLDEHDDFPITDKSYYRNSLSEIKKLCNKEMQKWKVKC